MKETKGFWVGKLRRKIFTVLLVILAFNLASCGANSTILSITPTALPAVSSTNTTIAQATNTATPIVITTPTILVSPSVSVFKITPKPLASQNSWQWSWLKGIPCKAPCFENITPGVTTASEAEVLLKSNPLAVNIVKDDTLQELKWDWVNTTSLGRVLFGTDANQIVYYIIPLFPNSFKLGDIIKVYGEPTHIYATGPASLDVKSFHLTIIFASYGFAFTTIAYDQPMKISSDLLSISINFAEPTIEAFAKISNTNLRLYQKWEGYKDFAYYCRTTAGTVIKPCTNI